VYLYTLAVELEEVLKSRPCLANQSGLIAETIIDVTPLLPIPDAFWVGPSLTLLATSWHAIQLNKRGS